MRARRAEASPSELRAQSVAVVRRLIALVPRSATVGIYAAMPGEIDVEAVELLAAHAARLAWPRCDTGRRLEFVALDAAPTTVGTWGIREPLEGAALNPEELDVLVVPGLAFAPSGARLGNGAGYYDRYLKRIRPDALRIGVCADWQIIDSVPLLPHDVRMTHVVSELRTLAATLAGPSDRVEPSPHGMSHPPAAP